jgi:hypothetical protein
MDDDEVMCELRQIRAEMLKEFGGDLDGLHHHLEALHANEARQGGPAVSLPPRHPQGHRPEAA